ncbi:FMN-linked oxidoreductase [Dentipellis sp. KUC8613]|nr:FMN-linked oxidoreductase [Dentipellis sp. KUC8613]
MSRRSLSASPDRDTREAKRPRLDALTPDDYRNGIMLAPMVRSGALPTRLFALKYGAKLVWGPEIVDKAVLHAERVVDPVTGVISYNGKSKAMFTCHPLEKPHFIFQLGSSDPALAVQAAQTVMQDVAGIDLNCGCPKPFSTHSGMGAALLSNPDLLCAILTALRAALPAHISVSAKIRLLPTSEETLKLVGRILDTGVNCLTVHCRTRNMRQREPAIQHRLNEIVEFVRASGKDVAVIQNGDCVGYEDARRIRAVTGADSAMIATAAEANPSVFAPDPLVDVEQTLIPPYIRLCRYLDNHFASTKFCISQFKGTHSALTKAQGRAVRDAVVKAHGYADVDALFAPWTGAEVFEDIKRTVEARGKGEPMLLPAEDFTPPAPSSQAESDIASTPAPSSQNAAKPDTKTPPDWRGNPEPAVVHDAPLGPVNERRRLVPSGVTRQDAATPTPTPMPPHALAAASVQDL